MIGLLREAQGVQTFLESHGWSFCFIGGIALLRWGEPRVTEDVDLTLFTGFGDEHPFVDALLGKFQGRIADAREFALAKRVLLLRTPAGDGLDVALGGLPFEKEMIQRSSPFDFQPDIRLRTCSAEDLVVLKAFAGRGQDWVDVEGIAYRQRSRLQWDAVFESLAPLVDLKGEPEILDRLGKLRRESTT